MKFGISNLSWNGTSEDLILPHLRQYDYIETIFSKINHGHYSTQSIFYGSNVNTFDDFYETFERIDYVIDKCKEYGVKIIVLGSPSLRKGKKDNLIKVFNEINSKLQELNIFLCVEPNSSYYGGEYYFTISEIVNDIKNFSNIKTMIDTHNLILENENIFENYLKYQEYIKHIHFSEKNLLPIIDYSSYEKIIDFLIKNEYNYGITYELKTIKSIVAESKKFIELKWRQL